MAEYIEREDAIKVVANNPYNVAFKTIKTIEEIKNIPTADVVEVVRCKDCEHFLLGSLACIHPCHNGWCSINHYCGNGERKVDNDS